MHKVKNNPIENDDAVNKEYVDDSILTKQDKTDNALETTDKTVVGAINEINDSLLDNVTFSADYKNIILNRKGGLNPYSIPIASIIHNAKITELNDVDSTNIGDGKTLVYDGAEKKHKYVDSTGTDELVKMESSTDAKYLADLIDKSTIVNDNGTLKVKKLDGQEVTIAEINHLKGLTMNVMDLVNAFANGGVKVLNTPVNTHADLSKLDRSTFLDGISYIVYVLADENHSGAKTTYLCDKTSETYFGNADSQRNFTTNPIDLANEVTGKLGASNIDVDNLWDLLTINDTYKTLTAKDEVFGTHGAKALYDELVTDIGKKANATDLTTHTSDTNIHITTSERTAWNEVDNKVDKTSIVTSVDIMSTEKQIPSAAAFYNECQGKPISINDINTYGTKILRYPVGRWRTNTHKTASLFSDLPVPSAFFIDIFSLNNDKNENPWNASWAYNFYVFYPLGANGYYIRSIQSSEPVGNIGYDSGWQKICTTNVADVPWTDVTDTLATSDVTSGNLDYFVKDGKCYIEFDAIKIATTGNGISMSSFNFPIPYLNRSCGYKTIQSLKGDKSLLITVERNGKLKYWAKEYNVDGLFYGSFSYPVAEQ